MIKYFKKEKNILLIMAIRVHLHTYFIVDF
jgi:hypothetical protein